MPLDATVEFTYFAPDRGDYSKTMVSMFGEPYHWPLQSMPHSVTIGLDRAYGLVYWPGETITLHVAGTDATKIDKITVTSQLNGPDLTIETQGTDRVIKIPDTLPAAPYMAIYRVHCYSDGTEVSSRGFIVARPWSHVFRTGHNPAFPQSNIAFGEWRNGSNPFCYMVEWEPEFWWGPEDTWFPWRDRPYQDTDKGILEIYYPRHEYTSRNAQDAGDQPNDSTNSYFDPSYEWNYLWCYSGRGLGRWDGNWTWGPFDKVSASWIQNEKTTSGHPELDINICYADLRRVSGAFPNGMLFYQWCYPGTKRLALRSMKFSAGPNLTPQLQFGAYDGWAPDSLTTSWTDSPGMIDLYYRRSQQEHTDLSWGDNGGAFRAFMESQREKMRDGDTKNDFGARFTDLDLARRNFYCLQLAAWDAYLEAENKEAVDYRSGLVGTPVWEGTVLNDRRPELRPDRLPWNELFNNGFGQGAFDTSGSGDTSHLWYLANGVSNDQAKERFYRWRGYQGAAMCALWPQCYYGGANGERLNGWAPGTPRINEPDIPPILFDTIDAQRDDGQSYRRFEVNNRLPMFVRDNGTFAGAERESFFGSDGSNDLTGSTPVNPTWITQIALAMQVMEIPDRKRPLGGAIVLDSDNYDARQLHQEYVTENLTNYCTSLHDLLGVVTYANPESAKLLPPEIARIHAPKRDGDDRVWLIAEVGETKIKMPYAGSGALVANDPHMIDFANQVAAAMPGGWPVRTTGGFVAAAFESTRGVWVVVENPVAAPGQIHSSRTGSVTVRCRGLDPAAQEPLVVDLIGGEEPDPHVLPSNDVSVSGNWITIDLDWQHGDCRVYMIHHTAV